MDSAPQEDWNEYQWERFLQEQDRKVDRLLGLLEEYADHPERDRMICREMGWNEWEENDPRFLHTSQDLFDLEPAVADEEEEDEEAGDYADDGDDDDEEEEEGLFEHPLHRRALALAMRVIRGLERRPELEQDEDATALASLCADCSAKLAAALNGAETSEPGMTIAYLKRALKAVGDAIASAANLKSRNAITKTTHARVLNALFSVRHDIVSLMGEFRRRGKKASG